MPVADPSDSPKGSGSFQLPSKSHAWPQPHLGNTNYAALLAMAAHHVPILKVEMVQEESQQFIYLFIFKR